MIKIIPAKSGKRKDSGIILLIVLWLLVILSLIAIGLGRRTSVDFSLAKYGVGKLKADFTARAGLTYALEQISRDAQDSTTAAWDTLYQCGVKIEEGQVPEDIFKHAAVGEGYFDIQYSVAALDGTVNARYGLQDETAKINLNALNQVNFSVLKHLITFLGFEDGVANTVAAAVVDWVDADSDVTAAPHGAEDDDYMSLSKPYHCKNLPFDSLEELFLVKGMTSEIFATLKDYVTVYPKETDTLSINVNTAPEVVIRALGYSLPDSTADADRITRNIIAYRSGEDQEIFTADDRPVELIDPGKMGFTDSETGFLHNLRNRGLGLSSNYFRVNIRGVTEASLIKSDIEAVVSRENSERNSDVLFWRRK